MDVVTSKSLPSSALNLFVFLMIAIIWPQDAFPQSNLQKMRMVSLRGRCIRVMAFNRALSTQCSPDPANALLLNTSYPDGRSGFYVVTDGLVLTFSGMGTQQIKTSPDSVVQPVDLILLNRVVGADPSKPTKLRATGTCSYEDPTRGVPTKIQCNAQTEAGQFALEFLHSGASPEHLGN